MFIFDYISLHMRKLTVTLRMIRWTYLYVPKKEQPVRNGDL